MTLWTAIDREREGKRAAGRRGHAAERHTHTRARPCSRLDLVCVVVEQEAWSRNGRRAM